MRTGEESLKFLWESDSDRGKLKKLHGKVQERFGRSSINAQEYCFVITKSGHQILRLVVLFIWNRLWTS